MTLKTEAEAKKTWCPEGRAVGPFFAPDRLPGGPRQLLGIATSNRGDASTNCIGAQCMAWRFVDHIDRVEEEVKWIGKPKGETNPPFSNCPVGFKVTSHDLTTYRAARETARHPRRGYCGKYSKPEVEE